MHYPVADLQQKQLQEIRELEQQLGVVLIAYNTTQDQTTHPQQINQQRELDFF
ncbi:hypothetical protein [Bacillus sp. FJAT-45037]|uniref:hypothetical protein n=1 Tax=Bacillus sp. FJAT-45037 TaxID=2011007 RepID=UPI0018E27493|nr:hypothetical protein [Bacillus sp. FJAT-45037]